MSVLRDTTRFLWCTEGTQSKEEDDMALSSHLQELRKKHQSLSEQVEAAQRSPSTDDLEITDLKKQKLRLKEEIQRLSADA
jgi:hypothetical protein